jgi:antitoxin VapB
VVGREHLAYYVRNTALAGETKTQAVRTALQERKERLQARRRRRHRADRLNRFLNDGAWPQIPDTVLG